MFILQEAQITHEFCFRSGSIKRVSQIFAPAQKKAAQNPLQVPRRSIPALSASQSQNPQRALLRLRFYAAKQMPLGYSIVTAKSASKYSVIPEKLIYGQALRRNGRNAGRWYWFSSRFPL
jgi:hypothetical protein